MDFLKRFFSLDHANLNDINHRMGFVIPSNSNIQSHNLLVLRCMNMIWHKCFPMLFVNVYNLLIRWMPVDKFIESMKALQLTTHFVIKAICRVVLSISFHTYIDCWVKNNIQVKKINDNDKHLKLSKCVCLTNLWTNCRYQSDVCSRVDFNWNQVEQTLTIWQLSHKIVCSTFIMIQETNENQKHQFNTN